MPPGRKPKVPLAPLSPAQQALAAASAPMARRIAGKLGGGDPDVESDALYGLVVAAVRWDGETPWEAWAYWDIRSAICQGRRARARAARATVARVERAEDAEAVGADLEWRDWLDHLCGLLPPGEAEAVRAEFTRCRDRRRGSARNNRIWRACRRLRAVLAPAG